jgi:integrase
MHVSNYFMTTLDELKTQINALTAKIETLAAMVSPAPVPAPTLAEWLQTWLDTYKRPKVRPNTYRDYRRLADIHIIPALGGKPLSAVSPLDVQTLLSSLPYSRTRQLAKTLLNAALQKAVNIGLLQKNACSDIELKAHRKQPRKAFTLKEQHKFLKAVQTSYYRVNFLVYLFTGIRKSEIKYLRFDYPKKLLYVDGTKTRASVRSVPLSDYLIRELRAYFAAGRDLSKNNKNISAVFQAVCRKAGLKGFCLHSLRHTFATRCLENGIPLKVVQQWLGHSTFEVTANTYSHVTADYAKKEAKKLERIMPDFTEKRISKKQRKSPVLD